MRGKQDIRSMERRGVVVVWTAVSMVTLLGFAALAIDLGYLYVVRGQLQVAADAAALAATTAYFEDVGLNQDQSELIYLGTQRAQQISVRNITRTEGTLLDAADIAFGRHDFDNPSGPLLSDGRWNAVEVTVRCTPGSLNGPVALFFANIFGITESGVIATARAAMDDRFGGYRVAEAQADADLIPFSIHEDLYADMVENGPDDFSYEDGQVLALGDDIREITLYPWKWQHGGQAGPDGEEGSGNFGTLNIGLGDQGTSHLESQIENGITAEELMAEFGTPVLVFFDEEGGSNTYEATGNPGVSVGMKDTVAARIGDKVGFFIHRNVVEEGANTIYEITGLRFGRIVDVHFTGNPESRSLTIQPEPYTGSSIIVEEFADPTDGYVGRAILVR